MASATLWTIYSNTWDLKGFTYKDSVCQLWFATTYLLKATLNHLNKNVWNHYLLHWSIIYYSSKDNECVDTSLSSDCSRICRMLTYRLKRRHRQFDCVHTISKPSSPVNQKPSHSWRLRFHQCFSYLLFILLQQSM